MSCNDKLSKANLEIQEDRKAGISSSGIEVNVVIKRGRYIPHNHVDNYSTDTQGSTPSDTLSYREPFNSRNQKSATNEIETEMGRLGVLRREYVWDRCPPDEKCPWFLHDKPVTLLCVVIVVSWLFCLIFSRIFIALEGPTQKVRKIPPSP